MSNDLIKDLSTLTNIPENGLEKLVDKSIDCICNDVFESMIENEHITKIDIGIGSLYLKLVDEECEYYFIPSTSLEDKLKEMKKSNKSPLTSRVEDTLVSRIMNVYKELI